MTLPPMERKPARSYGAWLLLLVVLAAAGYGGWLAWQQTLEIKAESAGRVERLSAEVQGLRSQLQTLTQRDSELELDVKRQGDLLANLSGHVDDALRASRGRIQLAAVEELLLLANDRLVLAHDAASAEHALEEADRRLAALADPGLLPVRQALAQERVALAAVPRVDTAGATLTLAELLRQASKYPLMGRIPQNFETPAAPLAALPPDASWIERAWSAAKTALASIFAVHRNEGLPPRLLAPEEEALVRQVLELKLEGARLALIAGDSAAFHDLVAAAQRWLVQYFNGQDPAVEVARRELERLGRLELSPPLPDISRSLVLLRGRLTSRAP